MLMAELVMPATFDALILYEPAVARRDSGTERVQNQFASVARRRRSEFRTLAEARANFAGKEPTKSFDTEVLDAYTEYGFVPTGDGGVRIKCAPESEAAVYESDGSLLLWDRLRPCPCQVTLVRGSRSELWSESSMAELAARVGARVHTMDGSGHFGPLQHPDVFADLLSGVLDRL
jgi:pimeloyl-ACP methyl ester carboxylesterase